MSAVVKAVKSVVNTVVDFVGDVVDVVGDVVEGALSDPIGTIATVAAVATGNAWAVPLIQGANTAIQGGDLGDIVKTMAISYATGKVASYVGEAVGSYAGTAAAAAEYGIDISTQAGMQQASMLAAQEIGMATASDIAASIVGAGARGATVAVIKGGDPVQAFFTGGVSAAAPVILGKISGFEKLSPTSQKVVNSAVTSAMLGQDMTGATIASLIASSEFTTKMVQGINDKVGGTLGDAQQGIITQIISQTAATAFAGGDPSTAFQRAMLQQGIQDLGDKLTSPEFWDQAEEFFGLGEKITTTADLIQDNEKQQQALIDKYNGVASTITTRQENQAKLKATMDAARAKYQSSKTQANFDAANKATEAYNDYTKRLNDDYNNTYKKQLETWSNDLDMLKEEHVIMVEDWSTYQEKFVENADVMDQTIMRPLYDTASEFFVQEMDPNFDADAYKTMNKLGEDVNPYQHWLEVGQFAGLPTNVDAGNLAYEGNRTRIMTGILQDQGLSLSTASPEMLEALGEVVDKAYTKNGVVDYAGIVQDSAGLRDKLADSDLFADAVGRLQLEQGVTLNKPFMMENITDEVMSSWSPQVGWSVANAEDITNGTARLTVTKNGQLVYVTPSDGRDMVWIPSIGTFADPNAVLNEDGVVVPAGYDTQPSYDEMWDLDPEASLVLLSTIDDSNAKVTSVDQYLVRTAQAAVKAAESTGDPDVINTVANIIKATGGISQSFGATIGLLTGDNPTDSGLYQFGLSLTKLGQASTTEEYNEALADINSRIEGAEGFWNTVEAIYEGAMEHPGVFAAEFIGVEATQELVPLAIGGAAKAGVKGLALAKGAADDIAERIATRAGVSAAVASDVAESVGGTAAETYETSYQIAIDQGYTPEQAEAWAVQNSQKAAVVAGITTLAASGLGNAALEKAIFGNRAVTAGTDKALDALRATIVNPAGIVIKEGVSEFGEEALIKASQEAMYSILDPDRDVSGEIAAAGTLGMIASGGTSGTIALGSGLKDAGQILSSGGNGGSSGNFVRNTILSSEGVQNIIANSSDGEQARENLKLLGIDDAVVTTTVLNSVDSSNYGSVSSIYDTITSTISDILGNDAGAYEITDDDFKNFVGVKTPDLATQVTTYVQNTSTTREQIEQAFRDAGYTGYTPEQVTQFVGKGTPAELIANATAYTDPYVTTREEAQAFYDKLGYVPTNAELQQFIGEGDENFETSTGVRVGEYVDPRQVTYEEAAAMFDDYADFDYQATQEEINARIGQGGANFETNTNTNISQYIDENSITGQELIDYATSLGYKLPKGADLSSWATQKPETELETIFSESEGAITFNLLTATMEGYEAQGIARDEALQKAIDDVATNLDTTREELLTAIGETEQGLLDRIGETEAALTEQIGETETRLGEQITDVETKLSGEIQDVADILGKPYADVTQADIDFVNDVIAQQTAQPDMALSTEQLAYDYNGDGVIDQNDLAALQTQYGIVQGTIDPTTQTDFVFDPATDTVWDTQTGVFSNLSDLQKQIESGQREQAYRDFLMMGGLQDQKVTVTTPQEGAKIGPAYDWSSIFATPQQAQFYGGFSPYGAYAEGGTVEDLLKLLEGK